MSYLSPRPEQSSDDEITLLDSFGALPASSNVQFLRKSSLTSVINASVLAGLNISVTGAAASVTIATISTPTFDGININSLGVINWASGDATLTHSTNLLTLTGAPLKLDSIRIGTADGSALVDIQGATTLIQGLRIEGNTTTALSFSTFVTGDSFVRLTEQSDGKFIWGGGTAVGDTTLYREAVDTLRTDDLFKIAVTGGKTTLTANVISTDTTLTLASTSGMHAGDKLTILSTVLLSGVANWLVDKTILTVDSSTQVTLTAAVGGSGTVANSGDVVQVQDERHLFADMVASDRNFIVTNNYVDNFSKTLGLLLADFGLHNTTAGNTVGFLVSKGNKRVAAFGAGNIFLFSELETAFMQIASPAASGFLVEDVTLLDAGTGKMRLLAGISYVGIELGVTGGFGAVYSPTRGGSFTLTGDMGGSGGNTTTAARTAYYINKDAKYNHKIGSQNLGAHTANIAATASGATTITVTRVTNEQNNSGQYLGAFTVGTTITITEAAKVTTTATITAIDGGAATVTITPGAADTYTAAAVITQISYTPNWYITRGIDGVNTVYITGETGNTFFLGQVSIGSEDTMVVNTATIASKFSVHTEGGLLDTEGEFHRHSNTAGAGASLFGARSRGTEASESVVQDNDALLRISAVGFDGTDYAESSSILFEVDDSTVGSNKMGGALVFQVAAAGTQTLAEAFRIANNKDITIFAGTGTGRPALGGTLNVNTSAVGNVGTGEDDLITYSLPASSLATAGDYADIEAWGQFAANGNNKQVKLYFGATALYATGAVAANGSDWNIKARVVRTGAATQIATANFSGDTTLITNTTDRTAPGETLTGAITIKCTGEATNNNDIIQDGLIVQWHSNA